MKEELKNQEVLLGTMLSELENPNLIRIMKMAGFAFVVVDCEHGYYDFSQIARLAAVGKGFGVPVIIRIPAIEREYITKVMDMGASGILVPMVETAEDAKQIVQYAKYMPLGNRGLSTTRAHSEYNPPKISEYIQIANENTFVFIQLETKKAIENLSEISKVAGIDCICIGPNDLSADLGIPGEINSPVIFDCVKKVADAAKKEGKSSGIISSDIGFLHKCQDLGMNVFSCNSEIGMLMKAAKNTVHTFFE